MRLGTFLLGILAVAFRLPAGAQPGAALDSLLGTWPAQLAMASRAEAHVISWAPLDTGLSRTRIEDLRTDLPLFQDEAVADAILLFGGPRRNEVELALGLASSWMPTVEQQLIAASLPVDLRYLPVAMSAMNVQAHSNYGEAGPWMLTYPVARRYGLVVTDSIDERRDPVRSTTVAIAYLKELYTTFGREEALLAYVCGPSNVVRAKAHSGGATTLSALYPFVDAAQRDRVPTFIALLYLAHYADDLGLRPELAEKEIPTDTLRTSAPVRRDALTRALGIEPAQFTWLNPTFIGAVLPANSLLRVPTGRAAQFKLLTDSIARMSSAIAPADSPVPIGSARINYKVKSGDNLGAIADRHGVTTTELKEWNELEGDRIHAGQILIIEVSAAQLAELERERKKSNAPTAAPAPSAVRSYTVRRGDTLTAIARRYPGVSAQDIMKLNGIGSDIRAGQKLRIPTRP